MATANTTSMPSNTTNPPKFLFEHLPEELKIDIFRRLPAKDLSRVMCVSKPCYQLVISSCLPKIAPFRRQFYALLLRLEIDETRSAITPGTMAVFSGAADVPYNDLIQQLDWCYKMMQCGIIDGGEKLVDYCNGLFLFCHRGGNSEILFNRLYYYYIINPITKQCIALLKPDAGSDIYTNAALAYHPSESSFFSIVQFRGTDNMKVFSSEIGDWLSLDFELPQQVTRATWEIKSIYCRGAVFRLSGSGHLLKFLVDLQESIADQAKAIELPEECKLLLANICVGVRDHQIIMTLSREDSLRIWVLNESYGGGGYTYNWDLQHGFNNVVLRPGHRQLVAIHPYFEIVVFLSKRFITCFSYSPNRCHIYHPRITEGRCSISNWVSAWGFPIVECSVPFTCCLNKKFPGFYERLPVPERMKISFG